jgi:tetracycline resistance efflux pump
MPYAVFVAVCSLIGFFVGGLFMNIGICWLGFAVVMALGFIFLPKLMKTE